MGPQDYWSSLKQRTQNKNESLRLQFAMPATFINYLYLSHNIIASVDIVSNNWWALKIKRRTEEKRERERGTHVVTVDGD